MNRKSFFRSLLTLGAVALVSPLKLFEKKEVINKTNRVHTAIGENSFDVKKIQDRLDYLQLHPNDRVAYAKLAIELDRSKPTGVCIDWDKIDADLFKLYLKTGS